MFSFSCLIDSFLAHNSLIGPRLFARPQNHCLANNHFGTNPVSRPTIHSLRHPWASRCRWQGILLQCRHTVATGCSLLALLIANCGLKLDDEAVRVAVWMHLGLSLCVPHRRQCGLDMDAQGRQCRRPPCCEIARHQVHSDIIWHALNAPDIPAIEEPSGLNKQDGKRQAWPTLIPWQCGKPLFGTRQFPVRWLHHTQT